MQYKDESTRPDRLGSIIYLLMFAVYVTAMVVLALNGIGLLYFFTIALLGFPVSGVSLSLLQGSLWLKKQNSGEKAATDTVARSEYVNEAGYPVIKL